MWDDLGHCKYNGFFRYSVHVSVTVVNNNKPCTLHSLGLTVRRISYINRSQSVDQQTETHTLTDAGLYRASKASCGQKETYLY